MHVLKMTLRLPSVEIVEQTTLGLLRRGWLLLIDSKSRGELRVVFGVLKLQERIFFLVVRRFLSDEDSLWLGFLSCHHPELLLRS